MKATITIRGSNDSDKIEIKTKFNPPVKMNAKINSIANAVFVMLDAIKKEAERGH